MKVKTPPMPEPVRMSSPDDPDIANAARVKTLDDERKKKGRASTALAGGTSYARTTLG